MGVGTGPEAMHAEMTSGSSATIRSVATDTTEAMAKVRAARGMKVAQASKHMIFTRLR